MEPPRVTTKPVIVWFRRDLRLADNPALDHAAETGRPILPVYVLDDGPGTRPMGAASRWWLDKSLQALDAALRTRGSRLILRSGDSEAELLRLAEETGADALFMNRLFEPDAFRRDADVAHALQDAGVECHGLNGSLLATPGTICTGQGGPYKVFTPFKAALLAQASAPPPSEGPTRIETPEGIESEAIEEWGLHPTRPDWSIGFDWTPGEAAAQRALREFVGQGLRSYSIGRDQPGKTGGSRLSAHLHWGELHPWRVVEAVRRAADDGGAPRAEADKFVAELAWRDFSAQLLHHFPAMVEAAFKPDFEALPRRQAPDELEAWKRGRTGYPIVDAGMRQLWTTGWMHNRVRMIVASFLVKDLLIDWREGEAFFWDTLVDADLGNNVQNWQWIAGSGADASPFFRIFNPVTQGRKFDAKGDYVRRWVPEIAALPDRWLHEPWTAPAEVLAKAGVRLGETYPAPIVDHGQARARALAALADVTEARRRKREED